MLNTPSMPSEPMKKSEEVVPMRKRPRPRDRAWQRRPKVGSAISGNFPWEIVLKFLTNHPRSLIILQLVDRNLRAVLRDNHLLWIAIYKKHFYYKAFMNRRVRDPLYPGLKLYKEAVTGVPHHTGALPGDRDGDGLVPGMVSDYVRRWYALLHGMRCGMCGCRYRHEVYWSLRMRVCRLCMAQNSASQIELFERYGLYYTEMQGEIKGRVFYYSLSVTPTEDRVAFHQVEDMHRHSAHMYWLPHLRKIYDLDALRRQHLERKAAAARLCAYVRKGWVLEQRKANPHKSVDRVLITLYRNERWRGQPLGQHAWRGGTEWAFGRAAVCKVSRHTQRTGQTCQAFFSQHGQFEDCCVDPAWAGNHG